MKKKHPLRENYERFFGRLDETYRLQDLERQFYEDRDNIRRRMKEYGFKSKDISGIRNYYDLATILGIDSRLLKDVAIYEYANLLAGLLKQK